MNDTTTAYLVSLGIIGAGAIWIDARTTLCIAIGVCCWIDQSFGYAAWLNG